MAVPSSAIDDFGILLLQKLESTNACKSGSVAKNLQISPFGISTVLSMLMSGSATETFNEICTTLQLDPGRPESELYAVFEAAFKEFQQLSSGANNELQVANSVVIQNKFSALPSFLKVVEAQFNSTLQSVDFGTNAKEATEVINCWVNEKTHGKIEKLFENDLDSSTIMVLLNAIYFKGKWKFPFDPKRTSPGRFQCNENLSVEVPMMIIKRSFKYGNFEGDGEVLEIPYEGDDLCMLIFLPAKETCTTSKNPISAQFAKVMRLEKFKNLSSMTLELQLPKFSIQSDFSLKGTLQELGVQSAFSCNADFSRINGSRDLVLADLIHKTMIEVNEEGAVAAAVTGAVLVKRSCTIPYEFIVDRPFLFAIRHKPTDLTLFLGVVNKP